MLSVIDCTCDILFFVLVLLLFLYNCIFCVVLLQTPLLYVLLVYELSILNRYCHHHGFLDLKFKNMPLIMVFHSKIFVEDDWKIIFMSKS